jgi:NADH-quinone oxidoreductase subunit J
LDADFLAAVQVLIYVGAITILILFAIMFTAQIYNPALKQSNEQVIPAVLIVLTLLLATLLALSRTVWNIADKSPEGASVNSIGKSLLTVYVLPFEVVSVVLLVALIGAIILAKRE